MLDARAQYNAALSGELDTVPLLVRLSEEDVVLREQKLRRAPASRRVGSPRRRPSIVVVAGWLFALLAVGIGVWFGAPQGADTPGVPSEVDALATTSVPPDSTSTTNSRGPPGPVLPPTGSDNEARSSPLVVIAAPVPHLPDPVDRVRLFYQYLERGDFENMGWLLSGHFKATMPWNPRVLRERTPSGHLEVQQARVVSMDGQRVTAIVAVRVVEETTEPLHSVRTYAGTWQLVRGPSGWLMDEPQLQEE